MGCLLMAPALTNPRGGRPQGHAPSSIKFFLIFMHFLGKIGRNKRLGSPSLENPRSTTEMLVFTAHSSSCGKVMFHRCLSIYKRVGYPGGVGYRGYIPLPRHPTTDHLPSRTTKACDTHPTGMLSCNCRRTLRPSSTTSTFGHQDSRGEDLRRTNR